MVQKRIHVAFQRAWLYCSQLTEIRFHSTARPDKETLLLRQTLKRITTEETDLGTINFHKKQPRWHNDPRSVIKKSNLDVVLVFVKNAFAELPLSKKPKGKDILDCWRNKGCCRSSESSQGSTLASLVVAIFDGNCGAIWPSIYLHYHHYPMRLYFLSTALNPLMICSSVWSLFFRPEEKNALDSNLPSCPHISGKLSWYLQRGTLSYYQGLAKLHIGHYLEQRICQWLKCLAF